MHKGIQKLKAKTAYFKNSTAYGGF